MNENHIEQKKRDKKLALEKLFKNPMQQALEGEIDKNNNFCNSS